MSTVTAVAQQGTSALRGTVTDTTGAVVSGATIKVIDQGTGVLARSVTSNDRGDYEVPILKPGTYRVEATMNGFANYVANSVLIDPDRIRRVDIALAVGQRQADTVEVTAEAQLIDTESGSVQADFDKDKFGKAPLVQAYPNPLAMMQTLPGVQGASWDVRMNGFDANSQHFEFDGVASDRFGEQKNNVNFFEVVSVTATNAPTSSASPVLYNMTSKRGSSAFHGSVHYQRFDSAFDARKADNVFKPHALQHDGQGEVGGPIWKDKTFFYASWFLQRVPGHDLKKATVPTTAMMNGDFSAFRGIVIRDPVTGLPFANNIIPTSRLSSVAQGVNKLWPTLAAGTAFGANNYMWTHPYTTGEVFSDYYKGDWPFLRIDHNITSKNSIYFTGTVRTTPYQGSGNVPALFGNSINRSMQFSLADTHIVSETLTNHAAISLSRDMRPNGEPAVGKEIRAGDFISSIGLQGVNPHGYNTIGMPDFVFSQRGSYNGITPTELRHSSGGGSTYNDWTIVDDVTWQKNQHLFTMGMTFTTYWRGKIGTPDYGKFTFDGRYTGLNFADFLLGYPSQISRTDTMMNRAYSSKSFGFYFNDAYKVTPKLTLNYGLRWDYNGMAQYNDGLVYRYDTNAKQIIVSANKMGSINPAYPGLYANNSLGLPAIPIVAGNPNISPDKGNFEPRFSVAYQLPHNAVIRGGYGLYWQRYARSQDAALSPTGPFSRLSEGYTAAPFSQTSVGQPPFQFPNPFPIAGSGVSQNSPGDRSQDLTVAPAHWNNGSIHNFNLSVEKEIAKIGLRASYIGTRGVNLMADSWGSGWESNVKPANATAYSDALLPFPNFHNVDMYVRGGATHYDAFQIEAQRRAGSFTFDVNYTLASDISNIMQADDIHNPFAVWAGNAGTTRSRFVATMVWNVPLGTGHRWLNTDSHVVNELVSGWTLESASYLATGWLFSPQFCGDEDYSNNNNYCGMADNIPGTKGNLSRDQRSYTRWFNSAVYTCSDPAGCGGGAGQTPYVYSKVGAYMIPGCTPTDPLCLNTNQAVIGRYGNASPNSLRSDPLDVHHLTIAKSFPIHDKINLTYSALISDLFNHPHFYNPDGYISDSCSSVLFSPDCGSTESGFEYNKAGFRSIAMKLKLSF